MANACSNSLISRSSNNFDINRSASVNGFGINLRTLRVQFGARAIWRGKSWFCLHGSYYRLGIVTVISFLAPLSSINNCALRGKYTNSLAKIEVIINLYKTIKLS